MSTWKLAVNAISYLNANWLILPLSRVYQVYYSWTSYSLLQGGSPQYHFIPQVDHFSRQICVLRSYSCLQQGTWENLGHS